MTYSPTQEHPPVEVAWSAVMEDVQAIGKGERNQSQNFNFRGIDTVMNAVGPALRKHRVVVIPTPEDITVTSYQSRNGAQMSNVIVKMRYTVRGPNGDSFDGGAYGEAADAGDKAVSKAQSVAYRVFLLQGLTVPTDEPDADAETHERATPPAPAPLSPKAQEFRDAANTLTGPQRTELRSKLTGRGLPSSPAAMSEDEAKLALEVMAEVAA